MPPFVFHLISVSGPKDSFLSAIRSLPKTQRPLYIGETQHWIHEPGLSVPALAGESAAIKTWDYLLVSPQSSSKPLALEGIDASLVAGKWSIAAPVEQNWLDDFAANHATRHSATPPPLPAGWSAADPSDLLASVPPPDLTASLGLTSRPLGQKVPVLLSDFIASFGTKHTGPVAMFNLLAYTPNGGREQYFQYVQAFSESTGVKYGGAPLFLGRNVETWSSKGEKGSDHWVDCALVWYPSIWHFGKMLDDPGYADVDRRFKQGAIRDNPLICTTDVDLRYGD